MRHAILLESPERTLDDGGQNYEKLNMKTVSNSYKVVSEQDTRNHQWSFLNIAKLGSPTLPFKWNSPKKATAERLT